MKRAVVFVDGQNLFHSAKNCFGYTYPNYDRSRSGGSSALDGHSADGYA